jgi:uncharacterized protein (TIGR03083 family)
MLAGQMHDARQRLLQSFEGLSEADMLRGGVCGEWSVRDLLAHLAAWDRSTTDMYRSMLMGERPPFLDLDDAGIERFNAQSHEETANASLDEVIAELHASREEMLQLLREVDNEKLFAPAPGDEHSELAIAACIRVTVDHDEEHAEMIEMWREDMEK